jgi:hypothetical protein
LWATPESSKPFGVVQYWLPAGVLKRIGVALPGTVSPMKAACPSFTRTKRSYSEDFSNAYQMIPPIQMTSPARKVW